MIGQVDTRLDDGSFAMEEGLPHAPMAMPEQQLERRPALLRGLRLLRLPVLVRSRVRVR